MLKMKLQYFGHLMRTDSLGKTLMLGKIEGRRRGRQRMRWLDASLTQWTWVWASLWSWWWTGKPGMLQSMGSQRVGHDQAMELMYSAMLLTYSFIPGMNSFDVLKKISCLKMEGSVQALQLQGIFTPFNLDLKTTLKRWISLAPFYRYGWLCRGLV